MLALLLLVPLSHAGEVTGRVLDSTTGYPIPRARVTLQATTTDTTADGDGRFAIDLDAGGVLVAASPGFFNGSVEVDPPASGLVLSLAPLPLDAHPDASFLSPSVCRGCHEAIHQDWSGSPMAESSGNRWVQDLFDGTGTAGGDGGFVYSRDSRFAAHDPDSHCAACHQPDTWLDDGGGPVSLSGRSHGVSCEVCHHIAEVDPDRVDFPGLHPEAVRMLRQDPGAWGRAQLGPLPDVDFRDHDMRASWNPDLGSLVCATCHQDRNDPDGDGDFSDGVVSEGTYGEWLTSAYADPVAGMSCVDCHMPPDDRTAVCSEIDLPRPAGSLRSHDIRGTDAEMLAQALTLALDVHAEEDAVHVGTALTNVGGGHHVPTGVTIRNVILRVEARNADGTRLERLEGPVIDDLGGVGDPEEGYLAGLPGRVYAKRNHGPDGDGPVFYTEATGITSDTRIPALATDEASWRFALPPDGGEVTVEAVVIYRRAFRFLVDAKGWTEDGHGQPLADLEPPWFGAPMVHETTTVRVEAPATPPGCGCGGGGGAWLALLPLPLLRRRRRLAATALLGACVSSDPPAPPVQEEVPSGIGIHVAPRPPGLDARPSNATCRLPVPPAQAIDLEPAWDLSFSQPTALARVPGADRWLVLERAGRAWSFSDTDSPTPERALDLTAKTFATRSSDTGLVAVAFHPDFQENGHVFLAYGAIGGTVHLSRIARLTSRDGGRTLDPSSEEVLLEVDQDDADAIHSNGDLQFGPDGLLYFTIGDGGLFDAAGFEAQDPTTLRGVIGRIDVDGGDPYGIPPDNPFADGVGGAPEVYAYGLRNVWRIAFDAHTGDLWAGDVGADDWEEVDRILAGGNYGWPHREGVACYAEDPCPGDWIDPEVVHGHDEMDSVTIGRVYHGSSLRDRSDQLVYGDFGTGRIWALPEGGAPERLVDTGLAVVSFAEDEDGELIVVDLVGGGLYRLRGRDAAEADDFPRILSETGCFDPDAEPAEGLLPYDVNAPAWRDGAGIRRWIALPDDASLEVVDGGIEAPVGTVLATELRLDDALVETRLLARHDDGRWGAYTYAWEGDDATLVDTSDDSAVDVQGVAWPRVSRGSCLRCHAEGPGGLQLAQLARDITYPSTGRTADQLATWEAIGLIAGETEAAPLPDPYGDGAASERARAWLHVNCATCHRPGGSTPHIDLHHDTPLAVTGLCDEEPRHGAMGIDDAVLVAPGDPERSVLLARIEQEGEDHMPPVGPLTPDPEGIAAVRTWIDGLAGCP